MNIAEKTLQLKQDFDDVYEAGKKAELDRFWDAYQENGNKTDYGYAFSGTGWTDETYKTIKYEIGSPKAFAGLYRYNNKVTDTVKGIDCKNSTKLLNVFDGAEKLKTIRKFKVYSNNTFASVFNNCNSLEERYIEGVIGQNGFNVQWSTKLSRDSLMRIINALSTETSGLSVTLSKTAVNKAFETNEGANDGSTSAEWLALANTKSNWTISLV
jgi:hypothetical protein